MLKTVITLLVIICVLASLASFLAAKYLNQADIIRIENEFKQIHDENIALKKQIAVKDSLTEVMEDTVKILSAINDTLRAKQKQLEKERIMAAERSFRLFQPDSIKLVFNRYYPVLVKSWRVVELNTNANQLPLTYFAVPIQSVTTTFIPDRIDAINYRRQRDLLLNVDSLQQEIVAYKDRIIVLEVEKKEAYRQGYEKCYAKYDSLLAEHIKLLKNPQIRLGIPSITTILGSAAAGYVAGTAAGKR